jgi:hypothetical protein
VVQAQAMLFNLKKLFVKWENLSGAFGPGRGKATFGVSQNLFQMSGHCHRELLLQAESKVEISNAKILPRTDCTAARVLMSALQNSIFQK